MSYDQQKAFEKLKKLKVGALFMQMGTGKTKVALDLINSRRDKVEYVLWICPFSLKNEIQQERDKWHPGLTLDIVGCESIGASDRIYLEVFNKVSKNDTFIVVDESLKIKNGDAKRTKRILRLGEHAKYKLILNGTPLSKNVMDLYTQMEFLSPKILGMSYSHFKDTYCEYYVRGKLKGKVKKQENIEHLISLINPYIFDSELDINARKNYHDHAYPLYDVEQYERLKTDYFNDRHDIDFFALTTTLQKHYVKGKQDLLSKVISQINDKVIVFVKYLESIPNNAMYISGDVPNSHRKDILKEFERNGTVLYITYGCGSYGLNLQFCKHIIFAEHCFDYAQRIQAEARIYRMGQLHDVHYHNLWCDVGLERLIRGSLDKKSNLLKEVKEEIEKKGMENWLSSI